jgi:hypothetical protein
VIAGSIRMPAAGGPADERTMFRVVAIRSFLI